MAKRVAQDRPLSFEEHGVIGEGAVASDVEAPQNTAEQAAAARPADASAPVEAASFGAPFEKVPPKEEESTQELPEGFQEWEGFKLANASARDEFPFVVLRPGHVFTAGGRYVDAQNVNKVYDVEPDMKTPEGTYLIGINYLVQGSTRDRIQRGEEAPAAPRRAPNPFRKPANADRE